ncbi:MAG TPA: CbiX/SirB N-terminal domain-containing protein [Candidatus Accumulibacter phosphatis]|nr:MAG: Sirohydrochlorin cobaltochelatase [Candidatus Accumulibacter sp. SK-11]HAY26628.1 cobalamin biosynthesis protein CbiX [Accumulibacter sp.]HRL74578.1 CbiX/SirB N-terminal domain-containing protein [Candidatus Accumulibacter phosphatis]HCN68208.1 cobalamin biosynthesis protein CbiX [Accumulibacter sp.]HCV13075.1 cobalamin biosynthesis protein CbiX [Accumulibacter sp.]
MTATALILFAHGARDPEWARPMQRVCALLRQQAPTLRVELAFLEFIPPDLRNCAEALVADGVQRVLVVPMFIARGGHLKRDLPLLLAELRQQHPGTIFDLADAVGEAETVVQAMAKHALSLLDA